MDVGSSPPVPPPLPPASPPLPPPHRPVDADRERERGSTAGAWAAAALVLALGALVFAVMSHLRISELEDRIGVLESQVAAGTGGGLVDPGPGTIVDVPPASSAPEQPVDPEAAKRSVIDAYAAVYDPAVAIDERVRLVDDPTGVAAALRQALAGPNAATVAQVAVEVNDVQFVSATRAKVIYGLTIPGNPPILGREGEARVAAGAWKVTRATVCADLSAVGGTC